MKRNMGAIDRITRIVLAFVFAYLYPSQTMAGII